MTNSAIAELQKKVADLEKSVQAWSRHAVLQDKAIEGLLQEVRDMSIWHKGRAFGRLSQIFPKEKGVVFLCPSFFGDNVKYAFLKFQEMAATRGIECNLLIGDQAQRDLLVKQGLPCLPALSSWKLEQLRILLRAKVLVVYDHLMPSLWSPPLPYFLLQGARVVMLCHGITIKEAGFIYSDTTNGESRLRVSTSGPFDVLVAPGAGMRKDWEGIFAFRDFAPAGYPRTDVLFRPPTALELLNVDLAMLRELEAARAQGRKVIFYVPTWRDYVGPSWFEKAQIAAFAAWCEDKGHLFFTKTHPTERDGLEEMRRKTPGVRFADSHSDLYPLLRHVDLMVTDYSSVALDFLLLDRPLVFYRPDHADYVSGSRKLQPGNERFIVGAEVTDIQSLCRAADDALSGQADPWAQPRRALAQELFDYRDGRAAERVCEVILKQLDAPQEYPHGWSP